MTSGWRRNMTERPCHDSTRVEVGSTWERISQIENVYPANRAAVNASTSDSQMGVRVFESLCVLTSVSRLFDALGLQGGRQGSNQTWCSECKDGLFLTANGQCESTCSALGFHIAKLWLVLRWFGRRCCWIWIRRWWLKYFDLQDWMVYWRYTEKVSNLAVQMVTGLVFGHLGGSIFVNPQVQTASSIFLGPTVLVACASFVQRTAPSSLMS